MEKKEVLRMVSTVGGLVFLSGVFLYAVLSIGMLGRYAVSEPAWYALPVSADDQTEGTDGTDGTEGTKGAARTPLVIIDPGHGGEDGGAVSASGVTEKTLNLSLSLCLCDMLRASGVPVCMTRTTDTGLYEGAEKGHRKMADLRNRLLLRNEYPDAVFLSVHMNTFGTERYHGMQIFYSPNEESSAVLADIIRETNRTYLQPDNARETKKAGSDIFLLDRAKGTAVLAECGFLSNPEEAARLSKPEYREKAAAVLCASVLAFLKENEANAQ